jgi:quercetin 2,3-dioxygenase
MIQARRSNERGFAEHGWLMSYHTFSFAHYYDPAFSGYGALRVINEDVIKPGRGFERHSHADMEIITYVTHGALIHKDSLGNSSIIRPGEVQLMRAGRGISHSEFNHSDSEDLHLLQIWILPNKRGLEPGYQQQEFPSQLRLNQFCKAVSPDGPLKIQQDATLYLSQFEAGQKAEFPFSQEKKGWIQIVNGNLSLNGVHLASGDGASIKNEARLHFQVEGPSEFLFFDLGTT